jgi:hypothetical protein
MGSDAITDYCTTGELEQAGDPIASLISKSEKAQRKLVPGTWQHTMLRDNLKALNIVSELMNREANGTNGCTRDALQEALFTVTAVRSKTEKAQARFSPGTSQHTLQQNRVRALRIAELVTKVELDKREPAVQKTGTNFVRRSEIPEKEIKP